MPAHARQGEASPCRSTQRRLSANLRRPTSSNSENASMFAGGHRVVFASLRSRVLSRCHSGFAGVLKRDRDFPFFFVNFVFRGGFGRHVGLINNYWPPYLWFDSCDLQVTATRDQGNVRRSQERSHPYSTPGWWEPKASGSHLPQCRWETKPNASDKDQHTPLHGNSKVFCFSALQYSYDVIIRLKEIRVTSFT